MPGPSAAQFGDSPKWDCAASSGPQRCWAPLVRAYPCACMRRAGDIFGSAEPGECSKESRVSVRLPNGSGERGECREHTNRPPGDLKSTDWVTAAASD